MSPAHFFSARPGGRGNCLTTLAIASLAVSGLMQSLPAAPAAAEAPAVAVVGPYDPATTYPLGSLAVGPDGNTYRAAKDVKGLDPTQATADSWQLALVSKEVILDVPARFESIADAMALLAGCRIAETAKVVVLIAPGKLEHDEPLVLNHAEGSRIVIRGAGEEPEDCVLELPGVSVSSIDGLVFENITLAARQKDQGIGINVLEDGRIALRKCRVRDFKQACFINGRGFMTANDSTFSTKGTADSVVAINGGMGSFTDCTAEASGKGGAHFGFLAARNAVMTCKDCRAENWYSGFAARLGGASNLETCVGRSCNHGASAWNGSAMRASDCTFAKNEETGVAAMSSQVEVEGCTLTANGIGVAANGPALVDLVGKPTTIASSRMGFFSHFGGRFRIVSQPVFRAVDRDVAVGGEPGNLTPETAVLVIE
jgi:hypothetical protein